MYRWTRFEPRSFDAAAAGEADTLIEACEACEQHALHALVWEHEPPHTWVGASRLHAGTYRITRLLQDDGA